MRKLFVLALLIALAVGAWMTWRDPTLLLEASRVMSSLFDGNG